jgi:hypothetical protein
MKRLAWWSVSSCLIAALSACTGTPATTPSPSRNPSAPAAATSGVSPAPSAPPASEPATVAVVTAYYRAVVAGDYQRAFGYLAPDATGPDGRRMTLSGFLQLAHMLDGMGGRVTKFSIGGFPSEVVMTNYRGSYGPYHAHLQMAQTSHGWAIISIDRI